MLRSMSGAVSAQPRVMSSLAGATRRAGFVGALVAAVLLPRPRDNLFDWPAVTHVWSLVPFAVLIGFAFFDRRSAWQPQLSLLALLSLLAVLAFAGAQRPWSTFLLMPPLGYLAVALPASARRAAPRRSGLSAALPRSWLLGAIVVLCAVHIAWATAGARPTDVGIDSVQGALNVIHGHPLYGAGLGSDTYGPVTFEAYVPFAALASGANAAARLATLFFTLLTALLLFVVGRRARGTTVGVTLAFCWLALPLTVYEDALGWNDSLVAAALVGVLLAANRPAPRGAMAAVAAWTKLSPLALVPLLALRSRAPNRREVVWFALAFVLGSAVVFAPALAHSTPAAFISHTFGFQANRAPVNSIWASLAQYGARTPWLGDGGRVLHGLVVSITLAVALLLPLARLRDDIAAVAAASAGVLVLVTLSLSYFAFSYLLWFAPLVLVAVILGAAPDEAVGAVSRPAPPGRSVSAAAS